jgi:RNA polymerase sigma-70 factor (ECF subfamily)
MKLLSESTQLQGGSATLAEPVGDLAGRREERARARTDAIFAAYGDEVERVCRALLRDPTDAEDAKQQTFLSAYRALLGGTEPRDVPAWLATIARHECYRVSAARKAAAIPALALIEEAADPADVHTQAVANLSAARLRREIRRLPSLQRDAILLREFAGLSYDELARELGVTRPAAHSLLVRARTTLRGRLKAEIAAINFLFAFTSLRKLFRHLPWRSGATSVTTKAAVITLAGTAVIAGGGFVAEHELTTSAHHVDAAHPVTVAPAFRDVPAVGALASLRRTPSAHHAATHHAAKVAPGAAVTASTAHGTGATGTGRPHGATAPATHGVAPPASSPTLARTEATGTRTGSVTSAPEQQAAPTGSAAPTEQAPTTQGESARSTTATATIDAPRATTTTPVGGSTDSGPPPPPAHVGGASTPAAGGGTSTSPHSPSHVPQTPVTRGSSGKAKHKSPPGQAKKLAGTEDVGYGQAKKLPAAGGVAPLPPGQSKKPGGAGDTQTASGQTGQQSSGSASTGQSAAPGQVKKADDSSAATTKTAPGQAKKDSTDSQTTTPPGQAKKQDSGSTQTTTTTASAPGPPAADGTPSSTTSTTSTASTAPTTDTSTVSSTTQTTTTTQTQAQTTTTQSQGNGNGNGSPNGNNGGGNNGNGNPNGNNGGGNGNGHGNGVTQ